MSPYELAAVLFADLRPLEECIAAGDHLVSCDEDGYCNNCGEQS